MKLMDQSEAQEQIFKYIDSKEWWIILQPRNNPLAELIEKKFYDGEANRFFHMMISPNAFGRLTTIFAARKKEMGPKKLAELLNSDEVPHRESPFTEDELRDHDILLPFYDDPGSEAEMALAVQWLQEQYSAGKGK